MSKKRFLQLLQALITMVNPSSPASVACAKTILECILGLARESGEADSVTLRLMVGAIDDFNYLIDQKLDFEGKPGDHSGNIVKQLRMGEMIFPSC